MKIERIDFFGSREETDSCSDCYSEESESDKLWRCDGSLSSEEVGFEQESSSNLWHLNDRLGHLYFQYFERSTPYGRVPLMDKVCVKSFFICFCFCFFILQR